MPQVTIERAAFDSDAAVHGRQVQLLVLRPEGPLPGDLLIGPDAMTVVARSPDGTVVGAATVVPEPWVHVDVAEIPTPSGQFRSLAVLPEHRGAGVGSALVSEACRAASGAGLVSLWAQARIAAVPMYERLGWNTVGALWHKPGVGPHRFVWRTLP